MLSLALALMTGVGFGFFAPWYFFKVRRRQDSRFFAREVCKQWSLPRDIGWFKGGFIRTDLDRTGQSVFIFKGRWAKFPLQPSPTMVLRHGTSLAERLESLFSCCLRALMIWIDLSTSAYHKFFDVKRGRKTVFGLLLLDCHEHRLSHVCAETFNQI